jgi:hypothetical protein
MMNYQNIQKPHFNVVITTPGSSLVSEYVKSLLLTIQVLQSNGITWHYQNEHASIVTNAREATITGSRSLEVFNPSPGKGQYTYDKIFCIDSDIVWNPDQFLKLYTSNHDVISGVYFESQGLDAMIHRNKDDYRPMTRDEISSLQQIGNPFEVYGVGLGFVCVKNGVFEKLKRPWYGLGKVEQEIDGIIYNLPLGEDLDWCDRVAKTGTKIYVDPTAVVGHVKSNIIC